MALREIITVPDPRLKEVSKPVEGGVTDELRALMDDMLETMYDAPGIGLAAIQIGVPLRVIVMDLAREDEDAKPRYFVNPEILPLTDVHKSLVFRRLIFFLDFIVDHCTRPHLVKERVASLNDRR